MLRCLDDVLYGAAFFDRGVETRITTLLWKIIRFIFSGVQLEGGLNIA